MIRGSGGGGQSIECEQAVVPLRDLHGLQRVGCVMDAALENLTGGMRGEEAITLGKEKFQGPRSRRFGGAVEAIFKSPRLGSSTALPGVLHPISLRMAHLQTSVLIGQMKEGARGPHGERLIAIQGEKPHAGSALSIVHVGADVEFTEVADPR